jgi:cell division protein FtsW
MPIRQHFDRLLLGATITQIAIGLAILASSSWLIATERYGRQGSYFFSWQAATAMVGLVVMVAAMHLKSRVISDQRLVYLGLPLCWLLLAVAFAQPPIAATHRWLSIGGVSLQPSVLARLALIAFVAYQLERAIDEGWAWRRLLTLGGGIAVTCALVVAEPDLGSAALFIVVTASMAFAAGMPTRLLVIPSTVALAGLIAAVIVSPYRLERVRAFLEADVSSAASWQSHQSLIAIGSGGLWGKGYGAGLQKLFFLPEPHTDFIYSITGEELGLVGLVAIIALAAIISWRGIVIAARQARPQRAVLALGLTLCFAAQTLIHMAVCLGLLPPKGIPLPLVSYGKTDLLVTLVSMGLLLNLSREVVR